MEPRLVRGWNGAQEEQGKTDYLNSAATVLLESGHPEAHAAPPKSCNSHIATP